MTLAKNDLALTAFVFGAYFALFVWMETQEKKWLILAGLFAGFALGVKYLALFSFCIQGLVILIFHGFRRSKAPRIFWDLILFTLITAAVGCVWYLRASLATGNPFYPYLTRVFGGAGLENPLRLAEKGVGKDFLSLILLPWNATFYPDKFGGMSNQWGPLFLAFLPWLALLRKKGSTWRYFLAITALSTLLWFFTKQNLRFLIPTLPFFCILVAAVLADLTQRGKWIGISAKAFFLAFIGLHVGIGIYHLRGDHPKHPVSKVAAYLNSEGKKPFKILSQEQRVYDFDGEAVRENIYRRVTQYPDQYASRPQAFREALRAENFTHVLLISNMDTPIELKNLVEGKSGKGTQPRKVFETSYIRSETGKQQGYLLYEL
jgi:4-amino-4-deoxy-L-arabinose transferase-like glycosyltransferase